jgi:hypothetical protein
MDPLRLMKKGNINIATIVILFYSVELHKDFLFTFNYMEFSWERWLRYESHSFRQESRHVKQMMVLWLRWIKKSQHTLYINKEIEAIFYSFFYIKANENYGNEFERK